MKNPPWGNGGPQRVDSDSIASDKPCPWPCLYHDKHHEVSDADGTARGTSCSLCGQFISRAEWEAELGALPLTPPPPFP